MNVSKSMCWPLCLCAFVRDSDRVSHGGTEARREVHSMREVVS